MDNRKGTINFRALDMGVIYDEAGGKADVAHRHDYYTVLLIDQATGIHTIDYSEFKFGSKEVHFVSPGQVHQVALFTRPIGKVITFTKDLLIQNNIPQSFISNINLFQSFDNTPPLKLNEEIYNRLKSIIEEMQSCLSPDLTYGDVALGALLQLFLIYCSNSTKLDHTQISEENSRVCILRDFKQLVEDKFQNWHKVKEYAAEIHISPKYLSQTVKDLTGKIAKDHIKDRIILESKRLLLHTDMTIKEIAYDVGFEEPLHFSGFFKRHAGLSPTHFRSDI